MLNNFIFSFTKNGAKVALQLKGFLDEMTSAYAMPRYCSDDLLPIDRSVKDMCKEIFGISDSIIFIGACSIAVRSISPFIKDKQADPAVIVVDEAAKFVIPILSGHLGGANKLAKTIADYLGGIPIITTATDINNKFSVDTFAAENNLYITNMNTAKEISCKILEEDIPIKSDFIYIGKLPNGLTENAGEIGIYITYKECSPYKKTLRLVPQVINIGIGCKKGMSLDKIENAIMSVLSENNISVHSLNSLHSIDLKKNEKGILDFALKYGLPYNTYTANQLSKVSGDFYSSDFVKSVTGIDNVCERCAVISGAELIVKKTVCSGVTVAVGRREWVLNFK